MPSDWQIRTLAECMSAIIDYRGKTPTKSASGIPLVTAKVIKDGWIQTPNEFIAPESYDTWMTRGLPEVGDVLLTTEAPIGEVAQVRDARVALAQRVILLRGQPDLLDNSFLKYLLQDDSIQHQLRARSTGTTVTGIKQSELRKLELQLPGLEEQRRIADALVSIDQRVHSLEESMRTLESIAHAIFKSWFVDFDPVRAKAEGREPEGMDAATAALFPKSFIANQTCEVPQGWHVGTLFELSLLNPESWTRKARPATLTYVDLANTKWGRVEATASHTAGDAPSRAQRVLKPGDTIIGTVRPGNGSYAYVQQTGLTGSTGFAALRPRTQIWSELVYLAATSKANIERLAHLADGAAYPAVRPEVVAATPIVVPPDAVASAFSIFISPLMMKMETNQQLAGTLAELRDTLLPRFISGKLRIPEPRSW